MEYVQKFGRLFDDFRPGDVYKHAFTKTITESDNNIFCLLTMNHHPVHLNNEYAKNHVHGKIMVVGTYVLSLAVGISVSDVSGKSVANLEYNNVRHLGPAFVGDTIAAKTKVLACHKTTSGTKGIVHVLTTVTNQNNQEILSFERRVLVPVRDF